MSETETGPKLTLEHTQMSEADALAFLGDHRIRRGSRTTLLKVRGSYHQPVSPGSAAGASVTPSTSTSSAGHSSRNRSS